MSRLEAAIDHDQRADEQRPADQHSPAAEESPPFAKVGVNDQHAEDADDSQQAQAEHVGSPDLRPGDLDSAGQANADAQNDRRENVDQAADDQARAQAWSRSVEDGPRGNGNCRWRLLTVWPWSEPVWGSRAPESYLAKG